MKLERFVAAFDIHGDQLDAKANAVLFEFCRDFKPTIRICGGDVFDFRQMRRKATEAEKEESMRKDYDMGMDWLKHFRPHYWLRGNHDERLWDLAKFGHGIMKDAAESGIEEIEKQTGKMGCQLFPYDRRSGVLQIGRLRVIHGYFAGVTAARQTALIYGECLAGHVHSIDVAPVPGLERRVAMICGCLCDLNMPYTRQTPASLRHAHGFVYGFIDRATGDYKAFQAESVNGRWLLSHDFKEY